VQLEDWFAYQEFRPGQKELASRVHEACAAGETLLAEAMSGFGKTAAVMAGALSAAEETGCKVIYACRTKRQINRVMEEVARLQGKHPFKAASLLSKFDYCLLRRQRQVPQESFGWYCSFNVSNNLCSYFLNVALASEEFDRVVARSLVHAPTHQELLRESEAAHMCPYEIARLSLVQASLAVVPYHYVFDPRASSVLFDRNDINKKKTILVVDEAHNIRDFFRELHSATITLDQVKGAVREARAMLMEDAASSLLTLERSLERIIEEKTGWLVDKNSALERVRSEQGTAWLQNLAFELTASSGAAWGSVVYERRMPSLILKVGEFLARLLSSERSILVKWENTMGLVDPDPVGGMAEYLADFRSSILTSATMNPSSVFARSIGLGSAGVHIFEAPAEPLVSVRTVLDIGTSTRYKLRTPEMFSRIADKVSAVVGATDSGVGVFAPSYAILGILSAMVSKRLPERHIVSEAPGLSNQAASEVSDSFRSGKDSVLFAVQGGRFSEGEDFSGDTMGSVVVVGLSLPPPSPMMYAEYACLKRSGEQDSFLMLSRLPALRKAFQAAGRHIRNPGKRGLVFLMDRRFDSQPVKELMPSWLRRDLSVGDFAPSSLASITREFWEFHGTRLPPS
jgi:DNA excision repair protein ERCC-2